MSLQIITLNEMKANARIDTSTEDTYLTTVCETAEQAVLNMLERTYSDIIVEFGSMPAPIKHACLMYATHLYEHRGITNPTALYNIPYTIDCLLKPYLRF